MQAAHGLHAHAPAACYPRFQARRSLLGRVPLPLRASAEEPVSEDASGEQPQQQRIAVRPRRRLSNSKSTSSTTRSTASNNRGPEASTSATTAAPSRKPQARQAPVKEAPSRAPAKPAEEQDDDEAFYADADKFERAILDERSPFYQPAVRRPSHTQPLFAEHTCTMQGSKATHARHLVCRAGPFTLPCKCA